MNNIRFPLGGGAATPRPAVPAAESHINFGLEKIRVLVVDDNAFSRRIARTALNALNIRTILDVPSARDGLEAIQNFLPDLILTDWVMEPDDGIYFVQAVRRGAIPDARCLPMILVSGHSETWRVNAARDAGVNEYVVKPYTCKTLYSKIRAIIESRRPFIDVPNGFFGPDRRRRYAPVGNKRRLLDGMSDAPSGAHAAAI
jgi:CheY-like chemotaxis protein